MTPDQKALWMLGMLKEQMEKGIKPFSNVKDAIVCCDVILDDFGRHYPPDLASPYWRRVKQALQNLNIKS